MNSRLTFLPLIILPILILNLAAQTDKITFKHITIDEGLSQNAVLAILQDHNGFIWFGTKDGLNRYDGYSFTVYRHNPFDSTSLSGNHITALCEERRGYLWVGTRDGGLNRLIRETDAFQRFNTAAADSDHSSPYAITAIAEDVEGNVASRIVGFSVRSILEDHIGNLWVSTDVLYHWNRKTGELRSFETSSDYPDDFGNTGAWSMLQAGAGELYFGTSQGLYRYDPQTAGIKQYKFDPADPSGLPQKEIYGVFEDRSGGIWIVTRNYLSKLIDARKGRFRHYRYKDRMTDELIRRQIYQNARGRFWLGTMPIAIKQSKSFKQSPAPNQGQSETARPIR